MQSSKGAAVSKPVWPDLRSYPLPIRRLAFFLFIATILVLPVWIVRYPPIVDYPNHLARYFVLAHLHDPSLRLSQFYFSRWQASPYVAVDILAQALQYLFPINIAGRLILSIALIALPLASYGFLRQLGNGSHYLAPWVLVVAYGPVFLTGLVNEMLSLALLLCLLTIFLKYLHDLSLKLWLYLSGLATLIFFTHLLSFVLAGIALLAYSLSTRQSRRVVLASMLPFVPGALVYLQAYVRGGSYWLKEANPRYHYHISLTEKLRLFPSPLRGYRHHDTALIVAGLLISLTVAIFRNRRFRLRYEWLALVAAIGLVYFLAPTNFHHLEIRILPLLFILGLAAADLGSRARALGAIALVVFLVRSMDVDRYFLARQAELQDWHSSFAAIPPYSRVFPIVPEDEGELFRRDYIHFWAYGVIERSWFSPNLFHSVGIHPLALYAPADDIARLTWPKYPFLNQGPPIRDPDWPEIQRRFDYVWLFDVPRLAGPISGWGECIYSRGPIKVFRMRRARVG